ncbi:MAG: hypothetical protein GY936_14270 [Ignavibacteriae bacterium]|nr:hypothetical protein [Ignavibacteriota bacterium]
MEERERVLILLLSGFLRESNQYTTKDNVVDGISDYAEKIVNLFAITQDQINAVVDWMNNWEQLKDTAIPLRFKDDWAKQLNLAIVSHSDIKKPPLGLKPKWIHDQQRQNEIMAAINRYLEAGKIPPKEWVTEFALYCG